MLLNYCANTSFAQTLSKISPYNDCFLHSSQMHDKWLYYCILFNQYTLPIHRWWEFKQLDSQVVSGVVCEPPSLFATWAVAMAIILLPAFQDHCPHQLLQFRRDSRFSRSRLWDGICHIGYLLRINRYRRKEEGVVAGTTKADQAPGGAEMSRPFLWEEGY